MRRLLIIGIGAGDPEQVTVQAIKALNRADVFFVVDKGDVKKDLMMARQEICERYIENGSYRIVGIPEPERDRTAPAYRPGGRAVARGTRRNLDPGDRGRTARRRLRRAAGLGRPGAVRQHPGDRRAGHRRLGDGDRVRGHPGHQQRPGTGRKPPGEPDPGRQAAAHHHRPQAGRRRHAGRLRRRGRDARRILLVHPRRSGHRDLLGRLPRHPRRDPDVRDRGRGRRPDPGRSGAKRGRARAGSWTPTCSAAPAPDHQRSTHCTSRLPSANVSGAAGPPGG